MTKNTSNKQYDDDFMEINASNRHLFSQEDQAVYELLQNKTSEELAPEKYQKFLERNQEIDELLRKQVIDILEDHPDFSFREVLISYLNTCSNEIYSGFLVEKIKIIEKTYLQFQLK